MMAYFVSSLFLLFESCFDLNLKSIVSCLLRILTTALPDIFAINIPKNFKKSHIIKREFHPSSITFFFCKQKEIQKFPIDQCGLVH